jgi:hypothetical protein
MRLPRLRFTLSRMMVAVAVAGIVLAFAKFLFIDNRPIDILIAAISALDGHSTVYSEGYSESKFRSLRLGMTARQVEDIVGPALERGHWMDSRDTGAGQPTTPGEGNLSDLWYYTRAGKARGNYWRREVWFRDGVVYRTDSTYYLD